MKCKVQLGNNTIELESMMRDTELRKGVSRLIDALIQSDHAEERDGDVPTQFNNANAKPNDVDEKCERVRQNDWNQIMIEVRRGFDLMWDSVKIQVDKAAILLGFAIAALIQIGVTNDLANRPINSPYALLAFGVGIFLIVISAAIGIYLFDVKEYVGGPNIDDLVEKYDTKEDIQFKDNIDGCIEQGRKDLIKKSRLFTKLLRWQLFLLVIGAVIVVVIRLFNW